jgi:hypothetical protein
MTRNVPEHEIEEIVRRVLGRMMASSTDVRESVANAEVGTVTLQERVVTLASLQALTKGTHALRLSRNAIVTPAAKDWLNEHRIDIVRDWNDSTSPGATTSSTKLVDGYGVASARLWVGGNLKALGKLALPSLVKRFGESRVAVRSPMGSDGESLAELQASMSAMHLVEGFDQSLLVVESPMQLAWSACPKRFRPVVVRQPSDVEEARSESTPNLWLIRGPIEAYRLNNLIRQLLRLHKQSGESTTIAGRPK